MITKTYIKIISKYNIKSRREKINLIGFIFTRNPSYQDEIFVGFDAPGFANHSKRSILRVITFSTKVF